MDLELFEQMDAPELRSYLEFFLRHDRVMDAFWFIYVTEKYGQEAEFISFGQAIDPAIRVECRFAPPGPHPVDMHCQWRFYCETKI
jgi:hypothetical protein